MKYAMIHEVRRSSSNRKCFGRQLCALAFCLIVPAFADVIDVTANRTFTDADQALIAASDGFSIASGVTLTFNVSSALTLETTQPISGAGNVAVTGSGKLHIKGANPDFTGKITVTTAELHVYNRNSTGPDSGADASGTELVGTASIHLHNCNLYEELKFPESAGAYIWVDEGDCYLCYNPKGKYQPAAKTGATFHTQSTWVPWCNQNVQGGGTIDFNSAYMGCFEGGIYNHGANTVIISKQPNQSTYITYNAWVGGVYPVLKFSAVDIANKVKIRSVNNSATWCNNIVDLTGFNQTAVPVFSCPYLGNGTENNKGSIVKSATAAYLRALSSEYVNNAAAFTEHAGFRWAGETDMDLIQVSTSDNELWVESSKLTIGATASWQNASAARAIGTGTLCLSHEGAVGSATKVYLTDSGKIEIPAGVTVTAGELYIGGTVQPGGTYGGTGSGAQHILPERFSGTGVLLSVRELTISQNTTWSATDFTDVRAQYGRVTVEPGVTLTFDVPASNELEIDAGFNIAGAGTVRKVGTGSLHLKGAHTFTGQMTVDGGSVHVYHNNSLGPNFSSTTVLNADTSLRLHAVTFSENVDFQGGRLWGEEGASVLAANPTFNNSLNGFFSAQANASLELRSTIMPSGYVGPAGDGLIVFNSDYLHPYGGWYHNSRAVVEFRKGCYLSAVDYRAFCGNGVLPKCRLAKKDVANTINIRLGNSPGWNNAELDLDGHDQTAVPNFVVLAGRDVADCPVVKSATAAYLKALASSCPSNGAIFAEHAGFVWAGSTELELCEPSTSDGVLAVESGTLTMGPNGSWTNAPVVTARGTGTLRIQNRKAFKPDVELRIEDDGIVQVDRGCLHVGALFVGGVSQPKGIYGASTDSVHFAGDGIVMIGIPGTLMIFR